MRIKTLVILLVILAVLTGAGIFVVMRNAPREGRENMGTHLMKGVPVNETTLVAIDAPDSHVLLEKVKTRWVVKNRFGYPADFSKLTGFVRKIMDAKVGRKFRASGGVLGRLHLEGPDNKGAAKGTLGTRIIFKDVHGKVLVKLILGKTLKGGRGGIFPEGQYVRLDDAKDVYLIDKQFSTLDMTPKGWLKKDLLNVQASDIREITCFDAGRKKIRYAFKRPEKGKPFEPVHFPTGKKVKMSALNRLAGVLSSLRMVDVADPGLSAESTGMAHSPVLEYHLYDGMIYDLYPGVLKKKSGPFYLRTEVRYQKPSTVKGGTGKKSPGKKVKKASQKDMEKMAGKARAQAQRFKKWVYVIPEWQHDALATDLKTLIEKTGNKGKK